VIAHVGSACMMTALPKMGKSQKRKKRVNKQKRREKKESPIKSVR
jgi:hypothetical protein